MGLLSSIGSAAKSVGSAVGSAVKSVGSAISGGASKVVSAVKSVVAPSPKPSTPSAAPSTPSSKPSTSSVSTAPKTSAPSVSTAPKTSTTTTSTAPKTSTSSGGGGGGGRSTATSTVSQIFKPAVQQLTGVAAPAIAGAAVKAAEAVSTAFAPKPVPSTPLVTSKIGGGGQISKAAEVFTKPPSTGFDASIRFVKRGSPSESEDKKAAEIEMQKKLEGRKSSLEVSKLLEKSSLTTTPRLSGLGVPETPKMPGERPTPPSTLTPGMSTAFKDTFTSGSLADRLGIGLPKPQPKPLPSPGPKLPTPSLPLPPGFPKPTPPGLVPPEFPGTPKPPLPLPPGFPQPKPTPPGLMPPGFPKPLPPGLVPPGFPKPTPPGLVPPELPGPKPPGFPFPLPPGFPQPKPTPPGLVPLPGVPGTPKFPSPLPAFPGITTKPTPLSTTGPMSSYKDYVDVSGSLKGTLGVIPTTEMPTTVTTPKQSLMSVMSGGVVQTTQGGVSTAFPEKYNIVEATFGPSPLDNLKPKTTTVEMPTQSFVGRIDPELGMKQVEQINKEQESLLKQYNEITKDISPEKAKVIEDLGTTIKKTGERLEYTAQDIKRDAGIFEMRLPNVDRYNPEDVAAYNADLEKHRQRIEQYNKDIEAYNKQYGEYSKEYETFNEKVKQATGISGAISVRNVMAEDIVQNINRSLVPEAIKATEQPERYGPGGVFENPFWSWKGQGERFGAAGTSIYLAATSPIRGLWGDKRTIDVNPEAVHNPFVRDVLKAGANNPYVAAIPVAIAGLPAGAAAAVPGLATAGSWIGTAGTYLGTSTALSEGYRALGEKGTLGFVTGVKGPLFDKKYTPEMDKEARAVLLGSIPEARLLPTQITGASGEWNPVAWATEGINLGFTSQERMQKGIDALSDYYKQQGLSDAEADYRISKVQDGLKISNQAEWVELASAGIGTNILGSKGVAAAQKTLAPKITKGIPLLYGAKNIPLIGKTFVGKAISGASTKTGARYLATRLAGMAPAGALEGVYFTGAQLGGRYNAEMTPEAYTRGALIGAVSAPLAQMYIERNFLRTPVGGVYRPQYQYTKVFGKELSKPTAITRPTARETVLFATDPLEPVSDVLTDIIPGTIKGIRTTVAPFTNAITQGYTWTTSKGNTYQWTPAWSPTYSQTLAEMTQKTELQPRTDIKTDLSPLIKDIELTKTIQTRPRTPITTLTVEQPFAMSDTYPSVITQPQQRALVQVLPQTQPVVQPWENTLTNIDLLTKVTPMPSPVTNVAPYIYPNIETQTQPDVITVDKFPPGFGWQGSLGESLGGGGGGRKYKEWLIANPIAQYGEEWFARQQAKAATIESLGKGGRFRLAPQGMQVINRVVPTMPRQQFIMPQQQFYNVEPQGIRFSQPQETPRQRAQRAVERGFGALTPLSSGKVNSLFKTKPKVFSAPRMPNKVRSKKGWM